MGFSFKVAPGVRIRASSRGVRTTVSQRANRTHGISGRAGGAGGGNGSGSGTFYTSLSGTRRRSSAGASRGSVAAAQRRVRAAEKAQQAQELAYAFNTIMNLHRASFPPAQSPVAAAPTPPGPADDNAVREWREQLAAEDLGMRRHPDRTKAKLASQQAAEQEISRPRAASAFERERQVRHQQQLDLQWSLLCANDPDLVLSVLGDAFADNEAPAAAVGVDGATVALVVLVPGIEAVPERLPGRTEAGNLSLRKLTKTMRSALYNQLVAGYVLTTIRETFAVAPGLADAQVVAIRTPGSSAFGRVPADCVLAARFSRNALQGVRWDLVEATTVLNDVSSELLVRQRGAARELQPLDLAKEPELAELLTKVDVEDLAVGAR